MEGDLPSEVPWRRCAAATQKSNCGIIGAESGVADLEMSVGRGHQTKIRWGSVEGRRRGGPNPVHRNLHEARLRGPSTCAAKRRSPVLGFAS